MTTTGETSLGSGTPPCELCGYVVRGGQDYYSTHWCNEVGAGVVLHKRCAERIEPLGPQMGRAVLIALQRQEWPWESVGDFERMTRGRPVDDAHAWRDLVSSLSPVHDHLTEARHLVRMLGDMRIDRAWRPTDRSGVLERVSLLQRLVIEGRALHRLAIAIAVGAYWCGKAGVREANPEERAS